MEEPKSEVEVEPEDDDDRDERRLKEAVAHLREHFDSVQIVVTRYNTAPSGGTVIRYKGSGNYYARIGSVTDWLITQEEKSREEVRQEDNE